EGEPGDAWYVIFEGQVRVMKELPSGPSEIATLGPGSCFGEMAMLDGLARSATVRAAGPLTMFRFRRSRFDHLLEQGSLGAYKLAAGMGGTVSQRHRQLTQQVSDMMIGKGTPRTVRAVSVAIEQFQVSE